MNDNIVQQIKAKDLERFIEAMQAAIEGVEVFSRTDISAAAVDDYFTKRFAVSTVEPKQDNPEEIWTPLRVYDETVFCRRCDCGEEYGKLYLHRGAERDALMDPLNACKDIMHEVTFNIATMGLFNFCINYDKKGQGESTSKTAKVEIFEPQKIHKLELPCDATRELVHKIRAKYQWVNPRKT